MATIFTFQPRQENAGAKRTTQPARGIARVIIFSGVRYERLPDVSVSSSKPAKKGRKTA